LLHPRSTTSKNLVALPIEDPRLHTPNSWLEEQQLRPDIYKMYNIAILKILSDSIPTSIDDISYSLMHNWGFGETSVKDFIKWLERVDTKGIVFDTELDGKIRKPLLYRSPRQTVPQGNYSVFIPDSRYVHGGEPT
jgi:hypothetical protein